MLPEADAAWQAMPEVWRLAYVEAWASFCGGNLGIGAVLFDPLDQTVVSVGRNRVNQTAPEPRTLSGNFMAHAEMNAFATLPRFKADGLHLYTTLQPCLMCAASAVFLHVESVFYAAADEFFDGVHELWDHHPYSQRNKPTEVGPLDGQIAGFARVLPLSAQAVTSPEGPVISLALDRTPEIARLALGLASDRTLEEIRNTGGDVTAALDAVWDRLPKPAA